MIAKLLPFTGISTLALLLYDYTTEEKVILRNLRTVRCGFNILYQYKLRFNALNAEEIHEIVARDIYQTCLINDGLYVKFGQGMASFDHVLPPPYFKWLSLLQDKAKSVPYHKIKRVIEQDFNTYIDEIFQDFEEIPIASASIAQVHRAKLKSGERVAVKIQKPNIQKQFKADMFMHWGLCAALEYAFDLPLLQFQDTIEKNLANEIDFNIELQNQETARQTITKREIYVPKVYQNYCKKRVLVTEWIDGIKVTHIEDIKKMGFQPQKVMKSIIECFAEQIFLTGFVHCDPHPGNLLVRQDPKQKRRYQVVLLDYGLCLRVTETFRHDYSNFWKALFTQDKSMIKKITQKWGIDDEEIFASMQLMRPYRKNKSLQHKPTNEEVLAMQIRMKDDMKKLLKNAQDIPEDLLFVNRNMNLVRSINKKCGSLVNRINVMAEIASQGADRGYFIQGIAFQIRLFLNSFLYKVLNLVWHQKYEEYLDKKQREMIENHYQSYGFKIPDEKTFDA